MSRARLASIAGGLLLTLVVIAPTVRAANEVPTRLSITPVDPITIGESVTVVVSLTLVSGAPIAGEAVTLTVDGAGPRRVRTDDTGQSIFRLPRDLPPGDYALVATYAGEADAYLGATTSATLTIVPFELAVETVPPLPGMVFELDGTRFVAGDDGVARISVGIAGDHELVAIEDSYRHPDQRIEFSRWNTEFFGPRIPIRIPYRHSLQAGFDVSYRVSQTFVDSEGGIVDPGRVTSLTLRNSLGTILTYSDGQERWYKTSRIVRRPTGLQGVPIHYTLDSVVVDGANVVNTGQERFDVSPNDTWKIELLLFSARLLPNDALFGFPIGDAVTVTYPDGRVVRVEAEANGELWARWLARGQYRVTVADAPGWAPGMPVALSRDQEVELRVISYLDMAVAVFAALGLAFGLLHVGRPHLLPRAVGAAGGGVATLVRRRARLAPVRAQAGAQPEGATSAAARAQKASIAPASPAQRVPLLPALLPVQTVVVRTPDPTPAFVDPDPASAAVIAGALEAPGSSLDALPGEEPAAAGSSRSSARDGGGQDTTQTRVPHKTPTRSKATTLRSRPLAQAAAGEEGPSSRATPTPMDEAAGTGSARASTPGKARRTTAVRPKPKRTGQAARAKRSTAARGAVKTTAKAGKTTAKTSRRTHAATSTKPRKPGAGVTARRRSAASGGGRTSGTGGSSDPAARRSLIPVPMTLSQERAVLEQRRLQLVSLGLEDPGQSAISNIDSDQGSVSDTAVRGAPRAEIGICAGCGLTLWVGAQFCRRCGRVQELPESVATGSATAGDGHAKQAGEGAAS